MAGQASSRIDELRARLQKDPGSIAFAQLAEELRRAGRFAEAIATCRNGLARHPAYQSARVTLGRALLETGELDEAYRELTEVIRRAPENLAAIRGLAELHRRRGELPEALEQYKSAFELAGSDPTIDQIVRDLKREVGQKPTLPPFRPAAVTAAPAAAIPAARPAPVPAETAEQVRASRVSAYLHRWLEAIMADRRSRLYGAARS